MNWAIKKIFQLYDEAKDKWYDVYLAVGVSRRTIKISVPREMRDPRALRQHLLSRGTVLPPIEQCRDKLAAEAEIDAPVIVRAGRTGWRDRYSRFVTHCSVRGTGRYRLLVPSGKESRVAADVRIRGTLEEWKKVAALASYSTPLTISLCAAFAAPLLRLLGRQSFAIVFVGRSRCGKSTAQLLAGSVIGFGFEESLPSLNATAAGLLEAATKFNDMLLPLNEIGTVRGARGEVHRAVRDTTYQLTGGKDVQRHSTWDSGNGIAADFMVLPLLSSEHSPDEWAARGGETRDAGETARLITYPVIVEGHDTIFDLYSPESGALCEHEWASEQFGFIRDTLPRERGTAGVAFIDSLLTNRGKVVAVAREDIRTFEDSMRDLANSPIERDIVSKFSVLYAGGVAAVEAGVLPLDRTMLWEAVGRACNSSLGALPDANADLHVDLLKLRGFLEGGSIIDVDRASPATKRNMHQADGFSRQHEQGRMYCIRASVFARLLATPLRARHVLDWFDDQGFLLYQKERKTSASNEWAQKQVQWPGGGRPRSICMFFPNGLDVLDLRK